MRGFWGLGSWAHGVEGLSRWVYRGGVADCSLIARLPVLLCGREGEGLGRLCAGRERRRCSR